MGKWDRRNGQYRGKAHRQEVVEYAAAVHSSTDDEVNIEDEEGVHDDNEVVYDAALSPPPRIATRICLWEFGQNDPKRCHYIL